MWTKSLTTAKSFAKLKGSIIKTAKTPFLAKEARFIARRVGKEGEIGKIKKLLNCISKKRLFFFWILAAVILFGLILGANSSTLAFLEKDNIEKVIREGSYIYSSAVPVGRQNYQFLAQTNDSDKGFGNEEEISASILVQDSAFLGHNNPFEHMDGIGFNRDRSSVITYEVQQGDTPSYIAAFFGISTNTLLWANNLDYGSVIKPGQKLVILPVSGVLYEVKKGETLAKIVKDYKGDFDETIAYNSLPADGSIQVGQKIIIPNGSKPIYYQPKIYAYSSVQRSYIGPFGNESHKFPWGQCTWYIAQLRKIPWGGNAKSWLNNAQQHGFQTGKEPQVGAIVATNETWYGHVAYVEAVNGDFITVSEMSLGRGIKNIRTIPVKSKTIKGYIY